MTEKELTLQITKPDLLNKGVDYRLYDFFAEIAAASANHFADRTNLARPLAVTTP